MARVREGGVMKEERDRTYLWDRSGQHIHERSVPNITRDNFIYILSAGENLL